MDSSIPQSILIVDDERNIRNSFRLTLMNAGYFNIIATGDASQVLELIKEHNIGVILLDIVMPKMTGDELLQLITGKYPELVVVIISGINDVEMAIKCVKRGAFDYIVKPIDKERLISTVEKALGVFELRRENSLLKENFFTQKTESLPDFSKIITNNQKMKTLFQYTTAISQTNQPVLISGETGVGKELFAEAIHKLSGRKGAFVPVNTAGVDSRVFSDTLFGHVKGAFTGAEKSRMGLLEKAKGGTIFLDEIGDLNHECQIKLLRLLQEKAYMPLGADDYIKSDVRVVTATNKDLKKLTENGDYREDFYYRLRTHQISIPPLRERLDDLKALLDFFLDEAFSSMQKKTPAYPPEIISLLKTYNFPGNIREFRGMVYDIAARHSQSSSKLSMKPFEEFIGITTPSNKETSNTDREEIIYPEKLPSLKEANESIINEALKRADYNQSLAAKLLEVSQQTFNYRLKKLDR